MFSEGSEPVPQQGFLAALVARLRRSNALREAHRRQPFDLKCDLLFEQPLNVKRFRSRLSRFNRGRFQVVWQEERTPRQTWPHFHAIVRLNAGATEEDFRAYVGDAVAFRKGQPPRVSFKLNVEPIDETRPDACLIYASKATVGLLRGLPPQPKGRRTISYTGRPYGTSSPREMHRCWWRRETWLRDHMSDPGLLEDIVTPFVAEGGADRSREVGLEDAAGCSRRTRAYGPAREGRGSLLRAGVKPIALSPFGDGPDAKPETDEPEHDPPSRGSMTPGLVRGTGHGASFVHPEPRLPAMYLTFREYVALRDGLLLPDRPPGKGLPRINTTPFTNAQRRERIPKIVKPPRPGASPVHGVRTVAEIIPLQLFTGLKVGAVKR